MSPEGLSQEDKSTLDLLNGLVRIAERRQPPGYKLPEEDFPNMTEAEVEAGAKRYDERVAKRRKELGLKPGEAMPPPPPTPAQ